VPGSIEKQFAADHPTAAGHFPGNPIIPGALLLDIAVRAVLGSGERVPVAYELRSVKFLRPVRPGERIRIDWHEERDETRFECRRLDPEEVVMNGTLRLGGPRE